MQKLEQKYEFLQSPLFFDFFQVFNIFMFYILRGGGWRSNLRACAVLLELFVMAHSCAMICMVATMYPTMFDMTKKERTKNMTVNISPN